ncbi:Cytosine-specific methyltransferase [Balamuthia mandrillaris]
MTTQNGHEEKEKEEEEEKEKASPLAKGKEKDCDTTAGMEVVSEAQQNKNQKKVEEVQNEMAEGSQWSVSDVVSNATFIEAQIRGFGDDLLTTCPFMVTLREVIMANKTRKQEKKSKQLEELQQQRMATSVEAKSASSSSSSTSSSSSSISASTSSFNTEAGPSSATKDASPQSSDLDDFALDPSKTNKRRRSKTHYIPKHKTVPEQEVELINENTDDMTNGGDDEDTIPTRLLEDFTVYDLNDKRMVLMDEIWSSTHSDLEMCASGFVTPILSDEQILEQQQLDDEEGDISEDISEEDEDEEDEAKEDDKDEEIKKEESDTEDFVVEDKNKKGEERHKRRKKNKKRQRNPESGLWVSLTTVFTWDVQISDGSIWLRTQFAWYKLGRPSKAYSPLYEPLVYRYQLSARVGALLQSNFAASYQFIVEQVREPYLDFPGFSEEDIQHEATHILEEVRQLMPDIDPSRQPFLQRLQKLLSSSANKNKWNKSHDTSVVSGRQAGRQRAQNIPTRGSAKRLERTPATVTPLIKELSVGLFNTIVEVKTSGSDNNQYVGGKLGKEKEDSTALHRDGATVKQKEGRAKWKEVTRTVKWTKLQHKGDHTNEKEKEKEGGTKESISMRVEEEDDAFLAPCSRSASKKRIYYDEASVDGEIIRPGDVVYLRADSAGSESWIGRVIAMWENKPTRSKLFHCRYFRRGHETILGETSGPHELFLTDECVVNPMSSIMGKCSVTFVPPNFITDGRWSDAKRRQLTNENKKVNENDSFFYRFWYDQKTACFEDVSKHDVSAAMMATELPPNYCHACHEKSRKKSEQIPRPFLFAKRKRQQQPQEKDKARIYYDGFAQNGQSYSVNDFVYVLPPDKYIVRGRNSPCVASKWYSCPYEIHQIDKIWRNQRSSRSGGVPVVYVSLRRLYRLTELNEYFSGQKEDNGNGNGPQWKPKGDPRELLWSNHLTTRMLSATSPFIEGICVVRKLSDIQEDLNNYIFKSPHTYYMKRTYIGKPLSSDSNNLTTNKKDGKKNKLDELLRALPSSSEEENAIRYSENSKHLETACGRPCDVQDMLHAFNVDPSEASHLPLDRIVKEVESWTSMDEDRRHQKKNKKEGPTSGLDRIKARIEPLRALDLFSGCGGFTQGLETSGVVKTCYAVEFMDSAAETLRRNHPDVTVLTGDCNTLLRERIEMDDDEAQTTKTVCLPPKGELDFIYCGPPCQGFSGINRFKKADDVLNSLIAATLSYVDYYRPRYFLLENVRGMISFKLGLCLHSSFFPSFRQCLCFL